MEGGRSVYVFVCARAYVKERKRGRGGKREKRSGEERVQEKEGEMENERERTGLKEG